jgi:hypothetical protein
VFDPHIDYCIKIESKYMEISNKTNLKIVQLIAVETRRNVIKVSSTNVTVFVLLKFRCLMNSNYVLIEFNTSLCQ